MPYHTDGDITESKQSIAYNHESREFTIAPPTQEQFKIAVCTGVGADQVCVVMPNDMIESNAIGYHEERYDQTMSTYGSAIVNGALFAAIPEAIGDLFSIYGHVSDKRASEIKWFTGVSMMVLSGGWMGAAASLVTSKTLKQVGVPETSARLAGNAVGFAVNTSKNLTTPLGCYSTVVQLLSGHFGLLAEKKVVETISNKPALAR